MDRMVLLVMRRRRRLLLPATLGTHHLMLKVDTGASCSVVPLEDVIEAGLEHHIDYSRVREVGDMATCGLLEAYFICQGGVTLHGHIYVSEECKAPILGLDVLYNHRCTLVPNRNIPHMVVRDVAGRLPRNIRNTHFPVTLNGHQSVALLDSGTSQSLIPYHMVLTLGLEMEEREQPIALCFACGSEEVSTHYVSDARLSLAGTEVSGRKLDVYRFYGDLIVGMNVLNRFRMEFHDDYTMKVSPQYM